MPRIPRRRAAAAANISPLGPGLPPGLPGVPGATAGPPPTRKPTRGALGGAVARGARMRLPPTVAPATRSAKKRTTGKRKAGK